MELGGKAPLIACGDADLERTARAIVYGGFVQPGARCASRSSGCTPTATSTIRSSSRWWPSTKELRQGDPSKEIVDVGAIIFPKQMEVAERLIADAVEKGAQLRCGGRRGPGPGQFFEPTVLANCNHSMGVMTEEIFGPIVPFMRVSTDEEALRLANESHLGLNAYVFSGDRDHGRRLARRIRGRDGAGERVLSNGGVPRRAVRRGEAERLRGGSWATSRCASCAT